ncbi:MAG: AAA family ATPase [Bacteroidales bacterium]|nr:AAA family ATPase [Bacteroidales bacterium]
MADLTGRKNEIKEFNRIYNSSKTEFVVVFGRRRVGKTFIVNHLYSSQMCFYHTGLSPIEDENNAKKQLQNFTFSLANYGLKVNSAPENWLEAFELLKQLIISKPVEKGKRRIIFIDEMPWLDTPKSGFMTGFEHFWNGWAANQSDIMLIVCGSATSWISDNLINNHGGLYNRVTREINLKPFTLSECREYYKKHRISFDIYDQIQSYMILGGIPYYLDMLSPEKSLAQNIDTLFFKKNAKLRLEYDRLFSSIFINAEAYKKVVSVLKEKRIGFTRKEISEKTSIPYGGGLSKMLKILEANDLITSYIPFGMTKKDTMYKLVDSYCLFYNFFEAETKNENFFSENINSPKLNAWRGYAFEDFCFSQIDKIKNALGITGVLTEISPFIKKGTSEEDGVQIDMVISRADRILNLCEIKFYTDDFTLTKQYDKELRHKMTLLSETAKKRLRFSPNIHLTLITTFGLRQNEYSSRFQNVITMEDF